MNFAKFLRTPILENIFICCKHLISFLIFRQVFSYPAGCEKRPPSGKSWWGPSGHSEPLNLIGFRSILSSSEFTHFHFLGATRLCYKKLKHVILLYWELYSEVCETSEMKLFTKIVFTKNSILDVWQSSEYDCHECFDLNFAKFFKSFVPHCLLL